MDPLLTTPQTFAAVIEADLRRAARLMIKVQDEIDWQLRIATPGGDYHLAVTMPSEARDHDAMMRRLTTFMIWKQAAAFTLAVETVIPDAIYCVGISRTARIEIGQNPAPADAVDQGQFRTGRVVAGGIDRSGAVSAAADRRAPDDAERSLRARRLVRQERQVPSRLCADWRDQGARTMTTSAAWCRTRSRHAGAGA